MKLIQLNMWGGRLLGPVIDLFDAENADILCLQEAISFDGDVYSLLGTFEEMQGKLKVPYSHSYFSPGIRFSFMNKSASWGNAIFSRYPFLEKITQFTHLEFIDNFNFEDYDYNARNFQHCIVDIGSGKKLNVLNHHGYHIPDHKNGNSETMRQMHALREYINGLKGPVILAGDFNLAPHSESLELINAVLTNLSIKNKLATTRTKLTPKKEVCDYIFVNDEVKVKSFHAVDDVVSDHKALVLEFEI